MASDAAMISASHDDSATEGCFLETQEIAAWLYMKTYPKVESRVAQWESEYACTGTLSHERRSPSER
eukprot:4739218-Pleurochrysis_carterae.AAC.1